jgi:hypothetical protein
VIGWWWVSAGCNAATLPRHSSSSTVAAAAAAVGVGVDERWVMGDGRQVAGEGGGGSRSSIQSSFF